MIEALESNPEAFVARYREAVANLESDTVAQMRQAWRDWQGEDSLHEMAFGEPDAVTETMRFDQPGETRGIHLPDTRSRAARPDR
jgi:hypothetical protein